MSTHGNDADTIRERLRRAGWSVVGEYRTYRADGPHHRVSVARGDRLVTGERVTAAEAWAEAERQALGESAGQG
jgi:hypothetical protein